MDTLPNFYKTLFNSVTDALAALDRLDIGTAREHLIRGQQHAEELYLEEEYKFSVNPLEKQK